jgi:hypothetical protein
LPRHSVTDHLYHKTNVTDFAAAGTLCWAAWITCQLWILCLDH